jgi:hypothetical protein
MADTTERSSTIDENRGIQNAQTHERFIAAQGERLTQQELQRKHIAEKARRENEKKESNEFQWNSMAKYAPASGRVSASNGRTGGTKSLPKISSFSKFMGMGAALTSYSFQFLFAILSMLLFGLFAGVENFQKNTFVGNVTSWFGDINSVVPAQEGGMLFWGLATIVVIVTFLSFLLWYKMVGINPFETTLSAFITIVVLSLSIIPFFNIFPWLIIWITYLNLSSLFSTE